MRVRFRVPFHPVDGAPEGGVEERLAEFYRAATAVVDGALDGSFAARTALERRLSQILERIDPALLAEVDAHPGGLRMVVTAGGASAPLADALVACAPAWRGVTLVRHRPPLPLLEALLDVRERTGVELGAARVRVGISRGHLLEVVVYSPTFGSATDERAVSAAELLVPRLVGDRVFEDWVGSVDVAPLPRGGPLRVVSDGTPSLDSLLPIAELPGAVQAAVRGVHEGLSPAPYHEFCERAEWTLFELEPEPREDYEAQDDVATVVTMLPEAMKCFLQGGPFASCRFSRHGELLAYLKVDTAELSADDGQALRVAMEDALDRVLVPGRVGCVVGAGTGARYVYVDLALADVEHGVRLVRRRMQRLGVPRRSWLLFCDSELSDEWVGVWDDSPAPPGLSD